MFDGNIAIASHVIGQKVAMNVWDGTQIIITSETARVANRNIGLVYSSPLTLSLSIQYTEFTVYSVYCILKLNVKRV